MLKKITLNNYATFTDETTIDFTSTNYKFLEKENVGVNKILKGALFVGENASGKTKILNGIKFLLDLLFANKEMDFSSEKSFYTNKKTFKLEYTFVQENETIIYSLEMDPTKIVSEKLILSDKVILERLGNTAKFMLNDEKIFSDIPNKLPFLRRIYFDTNFYENKALLNWFDFMKKSIYINCYTRTIDKYSDESLLVHDYLENNGVELINEFLNKIKYKQNIEYKKEAKNENVSFGTVDNKKMIFFSKEGTNTYIPELLESTGNKTFVELIPSFLYSVKNDCMIILDEFSSGFHNELEECLVKYFFHYSKNSQLFFTTHSTNILNNSIIRPDQIYSVYFSKGAKLKRFSEEMPRESQNIEKMYLNGVFNGMPKYNKFFED